MFEEESSGCHSRSESYKYLVQFALIQQVFSKLAETFSLQNCVNRALAQVLAKVTYDAKGGEQTARPLFTVGTVESQFPENYFYGEV